MVDPTYNRNEDLYVATQLNVDASSVSAGATIQSLHGESNTGAINVNQPVNSVSVYDTIYGYGNSSINWVRNNGDAIGLALSVGSILSPPGLAFRLGVMAIGIDLLQPDYVGALIGGAAVIRAKNPYILGADLIYGTYQVLE